MFSTPIFETRQSSCGRPPEADRSRRDLLPGWGGGEVPQSCSDREWGYPSPRMGVPLSLAKPAGTGVPYPHLGLGYPPGRNLGAVTGVPTGKDMGPVVGSIMGWRLDILYHVEQTHTCENITSRCTTYASGNISWSSEYVVSKESFAFKAAE